MKLNKTNEYKVLFRTAHEQKACVKTLYEIGDLLRYAKVIFDLDQHDSKRIHASVYYKADELQNINKKKLM